MVYRITTIDVRQQECLFGVQYNFSQMIQLAEQSIVSWRHLQDTLPAPCAQTSTAQFASLSLLVATERHTKHAAGTCVLMKQFGRKPLLLMSHLVASF